MSSKRKVDIVVISDVHLGTYGCQAEELLQYLKSVQPGMLVLNGDIIDIWQFNKRYWPKSHMQVIKEIVKVVAKETPVYYLTGNHDELLRKFTDFKLGNFQLCDQLVLELGDQKAWIFHGDIFDASMHTKWLAKLGGLSYDLLILMNSFINGCLKQLGREKMSFSKKVKNSVKKAISYISDFEQTAAEVAIEQGYDYVICGHIHQPQMRTIVAEKGNIQYLNSGDWVENLTALEYHDGEWRIFAHQPVPQSRKPKAKSKSKRSPVEPQVELSDFAEPIPV